MSTLVQIDGSQGEGGGQILRSALALSILTARPFKLIQIRAKRSKPGLAPQHLASVRAAGNICGGKLTGASIGSSVLLFEPGELKSGQYNIDIGTAGATGLVLHTIYLPLALKGETASQITIRGGTHVSHSPCYHFLEQTWATHLNRIGFDLRLTMERPGFYPRGGGEIQIAIAPTPTLRGYHATTTTVLSKATAFAAVSNLPDKIAKEMSRRINHKLSAAGIRCEATIETWDEQNRASPAALCGVSFPDLPVSPFFLGLGERGKPAAAVADEATEQAIAFRDSGCPIDAYSADQIVLPLAFAEGASEFRVSEITQHLLTNIETIRMFVDREITCEGKLGSPGTVRIADGQL